MKVHIIYSVTSNALLKLNCKFTLLMKMRSGPKATITEELILGIEEDQR